MGCAGFTCSKHALCALNILYVVSVIFLHMDHCAAPHPQIHCSALMCVLPPQQRT
uniref:Uncharacterized protein n=1 Tax=Seriola lalandi dorsalis TaxID=1841481 RepID=A0A3B4WG01_SERLL